MKYVLLAILVFTLVIGFTTECDYGFGFQREIQNDYRHMVDIAPGTIGFNGSTAQPVFNPETEAPWFDVAFSRGIWAGGFDPSGNLLLAASTYPFENSHDYISGPVRNDTVMLEAFCSFYENAWKIEGQEIISLQSDFQNGTLVLENIPEDILMWPAFGNPHIEFFAPDYEMAPFYDNDEDGVYDPLQGDHPIALKENPDFIPYQMSFSVFNDNTVHTESRGTPMKMEFHQLDYVVSCAEPSESEKSIFTRLTYTNRSIEDIIDFKLSIWDDSDLGDFQNDFVGCHIELGASYVYNNGPDLNDPRFIRVPDDIAVVRSLVSLNQELTNYFRYNGGGHAPPATVSPNVPVQYYNYLSAVWLDGLPVTSGGFGYNPGSTDTILFAYPDLPTNNNGWSMVSANLGDTDNRTLTGMVALDVLPAGASNTIDFVDHVLIDRDNLGLSVFDIYEERIMTLKEEYANILSGNLSCSRLTHTEAVPSIAMEFNLYPNPTSTSLTVDFDGLYSGELQIHDLAGRQLYIEEIHDKSIIELNLNDMQKGLYLLRLVNDNGVSTSRKFVKL